MKIIMNTDIHSFDKNTNVHMGHEVQKVFLERRLSAAQLANKISCRPRNVYKIFEREMIDTGLLMKICAALQFNFFELYSNELQSKKSEQIQVCIKLTVPIEDWVAGIICNHCKIYQYQGSPPDDRDAMPPCEVQTKN
jgi:DNA-binding Xre family transcriptional regulator